MSRRRRRAAWSSPCRDHPLRLLDAAERAAKAEPAIQGFETALEGTLGGFLHALIERRVEPQPTAKQVGVAVALRRGLADVLDEVRGREVVEVALIDEDDRLGGGGLVLGRRDVLVVAHLDQRLVAVLAGEVDVVVGGVLRRVAHQPGEHRGLADGDVLDLLAEVRARRRGDAVRAVPEVDVVEVDLEDLGLRELALEAHREDQLLHLAADLLRLLELRDLLVGHQTLDGADCLLADEQRLLDDLLGQGRGALLDVAVGAEVEPGGAHDADEIEAGVLVEPVVLGGQERGDQVLRHPSERDDLAILDREVADLLAVRRQHDALAVGLPLE